VAAPSACPFLCSRTVGSRGSSIPLRDGSRCPARKELRMIRAFASLFGGVLEMLAGLSLADESADRGQQMDPNG